jgi:hypothetical protein
MSANLVPPSAASTSADPLIIQMASGHIVSNALYVACELRIPDHLAAGPRTAADLAAATGTDAQSLGRVLRLLTGLGLFADVGEGRFTTSPLGASLRSDDPGCAGAMVRMLAGPTMNRAIGELLHSVRTGATGFEHAMGQAAFPYFAEHPEEAATFNDAMIGFHGAEPAAVASGYDFSGIGTLVDVGGGTGNLLMTVLEANPAMRGVVYDQPYIAAQARAAIENRGLASRCEFVEGNFFESIPSAGDAYLMSHIIHDWAEPQALTILGNCHRAMDGKGRLLLVEMVVPAAAAMHPSKLLDLVMLAVTGGRERTAEEYRELYAHAAFELTRVVPTASAVSIVEGRPATV